MQKCFKIDWEANKMILTVFYMCFVSRSDAQFTKIMVSKLHTRKQELRKDMEEAK